MSDLEKKLIELAGAGHFSHLSISSVWGGDGQFRASFSPTLSGAGQGHGIGIDPVTAAVVAIDNAVLAPARRSRKVQKQEAQPDSAVIAGHPVEPEAVQAQVLRESPVDFDDLFKKENEHG